MTRIFLLSPAHCGGQRAQLLLSDRARFDLARRIRSRPGAPVGEVFAFLSGLYFRGKLAYARAFERPPEGLPGSYVITPGSGLMPVNHPVDLRRLEEFAAVDIHATNVRYLRPLARDIAKIRARLGPDGEVVLLGSVATSKYVDPLLAALGSRLYFPPAFVGRGDMSRGGLLLRSVRAGSELPYVAVAGAVRHGPRPPRLLPAP